MAFFVCFLQLHEMKFCFFFLHCESRALWLLGNNPLAFRVNYFCMVVMLVVVAGTTFYLPACETVCKLQNHNDTTVVHRNTQQTDLDITIIITSKSRRLAYHYIIIIACFYSGWTATTYDKFLLWYHCICQRLFLIMNSFISNKPITCTNGMCVNPQNKAMQFKTQSVVLYRMMMTTIISILFSFFFIIILRALLKLLARKEGYCKRIGKKSALVPCESPLCCDTTVFRSRILLLIIVKVKTGHLVNHS